MTTPTDPPVLRWFAFTQLPEDIQWASRLCAKLAREMADTLPPSDQRDRGLEHLLAAKDCFARAAIEAKESKAGPYATPRETTPIPGGRLPPVA